MIDLALIQACAPHIAVQTIQRLIAVESAGDPYAIQVNGVGRLSASSAADAVTSAQRWIKAGYTVDLGLMQINSRHLTQLSLSVQDAFEPCTNLKAGAQILEAAYRRAVGVFGPGQRALQAAFSSYNTGDPKRGFANGYVARLYAVRILTAPGGAGLTAYGAATAVFSSRRSKESFHVP